MQMYRLFVKNETKILAGLYFVYFIVSVYRFVYLYRSFFELELNGERWLEKVLNLGRKISTPWLMLQ